MFTGIIQHLGEISEIKNEKDSKIFTIKSIISKELEIGGSIAINGACMTVTQKTDDTFTFTTISESLKLTNLNNLKIGDKVNLEKTLTLQDGIDGHLVQGHVDCMGEISKITDTGNSYIFRIKYSKNIQKYLAFKGSITINGVSLTISKLEALHLEVSIIPHTFKTTTFHRLKTGDKVNLEIDLIARYLDNLLEKQKDQASYNFLKERNLI